MNSSPGQYGNFASQCNKQSGAALIIFFLVLILVILSVTVSFLDGTSVKIEREKKTAEALARAKAALIGWAATQTTLTQLGQLPCPENTGLIGSSTEGSANGSCTLPAIGRLPWYSLGLEDLRDGNGDRLWYVISAGFRSTNINSDTPAQLTVDGVAGSAVAIVFSPGTTLDTQVRPTPTSAAPPNVTQYLDLSNNDGNNTFVTSGAASSFNDRVLTISHNELFPVVEKRVANEVLYCLKDYALTNPGTLWPGRHPWSTNGAGVYPIFSDSANHRFGRIPDRYFTQTNTSGVMSESWTGGCQIGSGGGWWLNWKELVFYAVAYNRDPPDTSSSTLPACNTNGPNGCLTIKTPSVPSGIPNQYAVAVIVAGKAIGTQVRGTTAQKQQISNYLEEENVSSATGANAIGEDAIFEQKSATSTFNDVVVFY